MKKILGLFSVVVALALATGVRAASFTPGNVVVYRVGDGSTNALVNSGSPVFLDEISIVDGSTVQSISIPTNSYFGANAPLIASGVALGEGLITRSVDGRFLVFTGFATSIGAGSFFVSTLKATTVPRVIGTIDQSGHMDTTTLQTNSLASTEDIRTAVSTDGTNLWISGDTSGLRYVTRGSTAATQISTNVTNLRQADIYSNTLYFSTASGSAIRIGTATTNGIPNTSTNALPTLTGTAILTNFTGFATNSGSPYAFALFQLPGGTNTLNTLYVADDGGSGGIFKYSLMNNGNWVSNGVVLFTNARYLVGTNDSLGNVTLVAAGSPAAAAGGAPYFGGGNMVSYTDTTGFNQPPLGNGDPGGIGDFANWAINPPANAAFHGIALTPVGSEPVLTGPAQLSVGPITDVFFSKGFTGGPFTFTNNYSVANLGSGTMTWSVSATNNWVGFSPASGTLGSGGSVTVAVTFNVNANSLPTGTNFSSITFTNSTGGNTGFDVTSRPVTLILAQLGVSPSSNYFATGPVNGPFTPSSQVYTLTNGTASTVSWAASIVSNSNWLTLSASSGSIGSHSSVNVTVSITNANALALSRGAFLDTIAFTNASTSDPGNALRNVSLLVGGGFTSNNLVIYRAGDGVLAINNQPTPVFLDEYTRSGVLIQSVPVSTNNYSCSGSATAEGLMSRSTDKQYLVFVGYGTNRTFGSSAPASSSTVVPRVVGRVDGNGNVDVTTRLTDFASATNPRGAVSTNGVDMWVAGAGTAGVRHTALGQTTSTEVCTNPVQNFRALNIYSNQLYAGSASAAIRITTVGSGLPTSDSIAVNLPGYSTNELSPYGFVLFKLKVGGTDPFDTLYVADDNGNNASGGSGGAIFKWSLVGGTWTSNGFGSVSAVRGLAGDVTIVGTTTNVNLFAVSSINVAGGTLTAYTDSTGWNQPPSGNGGNIGTVIASASANECWKSVILAPEIPVAAALSLTPGDFIVTDGPSSVTTNSKNYLVSDVSNSSMTWTATWTSTWLSLSTYGGTLAAGANTNVVASINGNATNLANGTYLDTITFVNTNNGVGNTTRGVSLTITGSVVVADAFSAWQTQYFGSPSNPQAQAGADPFGKGMINTNQFLAGFDPTNKSAYVHITQIVRTNNNTDVFVAYLGASGNSIITPPMASRTNVLEFTLGISGNYVSNNFVSTGQTNILSGGTGAGLLTNMVDPGGALSSPSRYYRVRVLVP